jgi:hypothetical protein
MVSHNADAADDSAPPPARAGEIHHAVQGGSPSDIVNALRQLPDNPNLLQRRDKITAMR